MSLEITVEKASVGKTQSGKIKTGFLANGKWFNVFDDYGNLVNKTVKLKPAKYQGWYEIEFVVDDQPHEGGNGLDKDPQLIVNWSVYENYMRMAHRVAMELEPDASRLSGEALLVDVDRSRARAALVNTAMIAVFGKDSKIIIEDLKLPF